MVGQRQAGVRIVPMQSLKISGLRVRFPQRLVVPVVCALLFAGLTLAQLSSADPVVTLVDAFKVRVRATPEIMSNNILASLAKGTQLGMTGQEGDWYSVTLPDSRTGWVHIDYGKVEEPRDQVEVVYEVVRVRAEPTTDSTSNTRALRGQRLHLLEKIDGWYRVQVPNEMEGWVREDLVAPRPVVLDSSLQQNSGDSLPEEEPTESAVIDGTSETTESPVGDVISEVEPVDSEQDVAESDHLELVTTPVSSPQVSETAPINSEAILAEHPDVVSEVGSDWLAIMGLAGIVVLAALALFSALRRRRLSRKDGVSKKKKSSQKRQLERTLRREIKEARNKLSNLEKKAEERLADFRTVAGDSDALSSKTSDDLLSSLEEMKGIIHSQQNRLDLYSELVSLQSEQIETYKKENDSIRKLLEMGNGTK
jgi:uncharacterized protein YgiM (DUF1202 family)